MKHKKFYNKTFFKQVILSDTVIFTATLSTKKI